MDLKVNIYKNGQHWKTKKFKDPRTEFVRDFNSVNGRNTAVIARESIEKVQKNLWLSRYILIPAVTALVFLATLACGKFIFSGQIQKTPTTGVRFFATTPDIDDPKAGQAVPIIDSHCAKGEVIIENDVITLPMSRRPYIFSWNGGFDQDHNPDEQLLRLGFRAVDQSGISVNPILFNDAEVRYTNSSYEFQRPSAQAIFDASDGPLTVKLEIVWGAEDLDVTEGWIELSQSEIRMPGSP